jgi:hypothetical protein
VKWPPRWEFISELSYAWEAVNIEPKSMKLILEAAARERLMKRQQAGRRLSGCCDDLTNVQISNSAAITCSSEWIV